MVMGSVAYLHHHRGLLSASEPPSGSDQNQTLLRICHNCDPGNSSVSYFCLTPCVAVCPDVCGDPFAPLLPPPPPPAPPVNKSHHLSPFLIVTFVSLAAAFLLIFSYALYARWYRQRNRGINRLPPPRSPSRDEMNVTHDDFLDPDQWPVLEHPIWYIRTVGLEASIINAIAACKYKKGEGLIEGTDCSVCLSEFEEDETLRLLPKCNHAFHMTCIDTWLRSHTNCPLCRAPIMNMAAANDPAPGPRGIGFSGSPAEIAVGGNDEGTSSNEEMQNVSESTTPGSEEESSEVDLEDGRKRSDHLSNEESDTQQQPMRRSVSVDSVSASKISLCVANFLRGGEAEMKSDCESAEENSKSADVVVQRVSEEKRVTRTMANSSSFIGKSLASSSSSRTRSLSSSGRFILSKYSRNRSSLLPL